MTGQPVAAEDLLQTALLKTARRWGRIKPYDQPEAYVRRAIYRAAVSQWRRRGEWPVATVPERATRFAVRPDTGGVVFQTMRTIDGYVGYVASDLYEVDPENGHPLRRFQLPSVTTDGPFMRFVGVVPEGIMLGAEGSASGPFEVLDPLTGKRREVLTLPRGTKLLTIRGG